MIDVFTPQVVQAIGAYGTPAVGVATALFAYAKRKRLFSIFLPKATLIAERDAAEMRADGALREARSAEAAVKNQNDSIAALQATVAILKSSVEGIEQKHASTLVPMQAKIDALVDWGRLMIDRHVVLESALTKNGIKIDTYMPPIPKILADRFDIPETLRDA